MSLTASQAGFIKGILLVVLFAVLSYVENQANLTGLVNPAVATIIASLASAIESGMKAQSNGTSALFGAVSLKQ